MKLPWHPLIGDPDSASDDAELDKLRAAGDSQIAGSSGSARLPTASAPRGAGERATLIGERWFEDEPAFLQRPETSRANIDQPAKAVTIPMRRRKTVRSLAVAVLRAVLASLEKDQ